VRVEQGKKADSFLHERDIRRPDHSTDI